MKKFGVEKYLGLLPACVFAVVIDYAVRMSGSIIAGKMLGQDAFAGIGLALPAYSFIVFIAQLVGSGTITNYSIKLGGGDKAGACRFFMQGIWTAAMLGLALASAIAFGKDAFIAFNGASGAAAVAAHSYLSVVWILAPLEGLSVLLQNLCYQDGDSKLCFFSSIALFTVTVLVTFAAIHFGAGPAGAAIGVVTAKLVSVSTMSVHFFRKTNTFRPLWHFDIRQSLKIVATSIGDASNFMCEALLFIILNKLVISRFGEQYLPLSSMASIMWGLTFFFEGISQSMQPIVAVYHGERNVVAIKTVMKAACVIAGASGLAMSLLLQALPGAFVAMCGISAPELSASAVTCVRIMAFLYLPMVFVGLFNSYYMYIECLAATVVLTVSGAFVGPVLCLFTLHHAMGLPGLWLSFFAGPMLGLAITSAVVVARYGAHAFPLMLGKGRENELRVFYLQLNEREIAETARLVSDELEKRHAPKSVQMHASLITEEVFMTVLDRAKGRKLLGEATLDFGDGVTLTLRDDGDIFDITDANQQMSSLRTFIVASVMERQRHRMNMATTGFNRNVFHFDVEEKAACDDTH